MQKLKPRKCHPKAGWALLASMLMMVLFLVRPASALAADVQNVEWQRLAGDNAYGTMAAIAQEGWESSDAVVVAALEGYWDALSASSIAGQYEAPVLLTGQDGLAPETAAEIKRLGATRAYVVGGTYWIPDNVLKQLRALGLSVERLSGANAAATSVAVAGKLEKKADVAIVATDRSYHDALAASPFAYAKRAPIFLTEDGGSRLPAAAVSAIKSGGFGRIVVAGGEASVSKAAYAQLEATGIPVERLAGDNAYLTADAFSAWEVENGMSWAEMGVATCSSHYDALTGGALCGLRGGVLMLADDASNAAAVARAGANKLAMGRARVFGGTSSVGQATFAALQRATMSQEAGGGQGDQGGNQGGQSGEQGGSQGGQSGQQGGSQGDQTPASPEPLKIVTDRSVLDGNRPIGQYFRIVTNNDIKSVTFSDDRILNVMTLDYQLKNETYFVANEIGTVTITFADVYGQTLTHTTNTVLTKESTELKSSRYDRSLIVPKMGQPETSSSYFGVGCPGTFPGPNGETGYQLCLSPTPDFDGTFDMTYCDYEWNGLGYVQLSVFYPHAENSGYVKVRSYRADGTTMVYGPWSDVSSYTVPNFSTKRSGKAAYSYEVYRVRGKGVSGLYDGVTSVLYVKTDNPDPNTFDFYSQDKRFAMVHVMRDWDDINYATTTDSDAFFRKVEGGYVANLEVQEPGTYDLELREANVDGYVVAKTLTLKVQDYEATRNAWMDDVIAKHTTASMNPLQKMNAVSAYLTSSEAGFKYLTRQNDHSVSLSMQPNMPWFEVLRWDSATSPSMLCVFAERIGGFDDIHNCFGDYPRGSEGWYAYHHMARVTYKGEEHYFTVCPTSDTGEVLSFSMVNFKSNSDLVKLG